MSDDMLLNFQIKNLKKNVRDHEKMIELLQAEWKNTSKQLEIATLNIEHLNETVEEQALEIKRLKTANERLETTLSEASKCMATALSATKK